MKKSLLIALPTASLLALTGCSSGASDKAATSTASSSPRVETTGHDESVAPSTSSSSSSTSQNPWLARVSPAPDPQRAWAAVGQVEWAANDTFLTSTYDSARPDVRTSVSGQRASDRKVMWTLDLTKPPVPLTDATSTIRQVGDAFSVTWMGTSGGSTLQAGKETTVAALYDIATGKQRGSATSAEGRSSDADSSPFLARLAGGYHFADGVKAPVSSVNLSEYNGAPWLPQPASDTTSSAYDVTSKLSVVNDPPAWSLSSDKPANSAQLWDRTTKTKLAETACKGVELSGPVVSPNGRYALFGAAAFDLHEHKVWCVKAPAEGASVKLISDTGTLYGEGNNRVYTQAWGKDATAILPEGATMPSDVLESATIYAVDDAIEGSGTVIVRTK